MIETGNEFCFVYSTFPDTESALAVGRTLVDRKLAACVNVYPPMTSVYVWQGKQEESAGGRGVHQDATLARRVRGCRGARAASLYDAVFPGAADFGRQ